MKITHVPEEICNNCIVQLEELKNIILSTPENFFNVALTTDIWRSGDVLKKNDMLNQNFLKSTNFLKGLAEDIFHKRLFYTYIHFLDYKNGGSMNFHNHSHAEDYSFILFLNDVYDGETNFYLTDLVSLTPKKSQVVFFESYIDHSGSFTSDKQILVGGLKKFI